MSNAKTLTRLMRREFLVLTAALLLAATFAVTHGASAQTATAPDVIAFERHGSIFTMNADGSNQQQLTSDHLVALQPAWSPDGQKLAFACGAETYDICVINADGSDYRRLTDTQDSSNPAWSPDGTRIAFTRFINPGHSIYVMNADGSNPQPLPLNNPNGNNSDYAAWSPDGTRIAFVGDAGEGSDIFTVNADGSGQLAQVTFSQTLKQNPAYSPDGAQIAFDTLNDARIVSAFGGQDYALATGGDMSSHPSWSPDGAQIAFYRHRVLRDENGSHIGNETGIFAINPATGFVTNLNCPEGGSPAFRPALSEPAPAPSPSPSPEPGPGPAQRINDLSALVRSFGVNRGITNSLTVKLQHALDDLNSGRTSDACSHLATFSSQASAQSGKHLTTAQANQIINEATSIRAALGCS